MLAVSKDWTFSLLPPMNTPLILEIGLCSNDGLFWARCVLFKPLCIAWIRCCAHDSLMTSTAYLSIEYLIQEQFDSSTQVTALGQSLFIVGNAIGPLCLGPLSYVSKDS